MQLDAAVVSIAAVFFKKAAIIIAIWSKNITLSKVILSGMYNYNFEAKN